MHCVWVSSKNRITSFAVWDAIIIYTLRNQKNKDHIKTSKRHDITICYTYWINYKEKISYIKLIRHIVCIKPSCSAIKSTKRQIKILVVNQSKQTCLCQNEVICSLCYIDVDVYINYLTVQNFSKFLIFCVATVFMF